MKLVGLTGGIASGKTTVSNMFSELGVKVISTDKIGHELTMQDQDTINAIACSFGQEILLDGVPDKAKLKSLVFAAKDKKQKLEEILHPRIKKHLDNIVQKSRGSYVMVEVPLLFEAGWEKYMNRTLLCLAPQEIRVQRLIRRDDIEQELALKIIASQMPDVEKQKLADDVLNTDQDLANLKQEVLNLHKKYLQVLQ